MAPYTVPQVDVNENGWGPTQLPEQYIDLPYAPFNRSDKLGKVADFLSVSNSRSGRYTRDPSNVNADIQYKYDAAENASFQLVDTAKAARSKTLDRIRPTWGQQRFVMRHTGNQRARGVPVVESGNAPNPSAQLQLKGQQKQNKRWDRLNNARRAYTIRRKDEPKVDRTATVQVQPSWDLIEEFDLQQLNKLQANIPDVDDVMFCGEVMEYDTTYDRVTSKMNKQLKRFGDRDFYYVTTKEDPVIQELATQEKATVFATDTILAHLMACTRSVYPWDVVVHKIGDMIFFDNRNQTSADLVTVNENASDPPATDDKDSINHPDRLSIEATMINQNFSQQLMKESSDFVKRFEHPNPFASEDSKPAAIAYRYRKWDLGSDQLIVRCEVNGVMNKSKFVSTFALNQCDPKMNGNIEWRQKIESQRGAILANELKNNSCKLAKWTAQALLSGVDEMKLGYVSRSQYKATSSHVILGVQTYNPHIFAVQIALNQNNTWGIIKMLVEVFKEQSEGKYIIMKEPNRPMIKIYRVPMDTFEDDESEGSES